MATTNNNGGFAGKVAFVTGAANGIGQISCFSMGPPNFSSRAESMSNSAMRTTGLCISWARMRPHRDDVSTNALRITNCLAIMLPPSAAFKAACPV